MLDPLRAGNQKPGSSPPPGPIVAALERLRHVSRHHLQRDQVPPARSHLQHVLFSHVVAPLYARVDAETDPGRRLSWLVLAESAQRYVQLAFGTGGAPAAKAETKQRDPLSDLSRLGQQICRQIQDLADDFT